MVGPSHFRFIFKYSPSLISNQIINFTAALIITDINKTKVTFAAGELRFDNHEQTSLDILELFTLC